MGLFRKRSNSSTTSTKLKRPLRTGTLPPEVPAIPPAPIQNNASNMGFRGPNNIGLKNSHNPVAGPPLQPTTPNVGTDGFTTPVSQVSGFTHPSSTAPSSVDTMSAVSSFKKNGTPGDKPQVQLNGHRISTSTNPEDPFHPADQRNSIVGGSVIGSEFDSRPSSMTVTGFAGPAMNTGNRKPPPPPLRDDPSTSTLPQEWTDRDPSINTRFTHSPTPSESASMQSSVVYPQLPQPERTPRGNPQNKFHPPPHPQLQNPNGPRFRGGPPPSPHQYRPNSASHRGPQQRLLPPPTTPRGSSYRQPQSMLPPLPENRRAMSLTAPRPSPPQQRPTIPPTPGPKHLAVKFTSNHIECNNKHKTLLPMKNYHHPVPCLTCRRVSIDGMQYCSFCSLRICRECADRLKKDWNGDITKGWGGVTPASVEFSPSTGFDAKMVVGWGDHAPPLPARNAVNQLSWPTRTNTERVCTLLGVPYRPKTAPAMPGSFPGLDTPEFMEQPQFSFESNLDIESGASTISPPSPVTPPAFATAHSESRLPLNLSNEHSLPLSLSSGKPNHFDTPGYGYPTHSPHIVTDSNPELVQPRPYHHTEPSPILNAGSRRSQTFSYATNNAHLYRTDTQQSSTTVGKARPVTGGSSARSSIFDSLKGSGEKKKSKGLKGLFSKK